MFVFANCLCTVGACSQQGCAPLLQMHTKETITLYCASKMKLISWKKESIESTFSVGAVKLVHPQMADN